MFLSRRARSTEEFDLIESDWPTWPARWMGLLVVAATLLVYWPALDGAMLWDDAAHVTRPDLRSLDGLFRIWFEPGAAQQYYPLLNTAFWLEHRLWGDATLGYHLVNVLLHATAACLFAAILRRVAVPGAWLAALLFALHPVCVESVAWISEQKNTLSLVFYLCAALAYLRFDAQRRTPAYALATTLFLCALLTKTVTATLPAALLVVFWWRRGRLDWRRDLPPLLPWFALGIAGGLTTAWLERTHVGASGGEFALGAAERVLVAGRAIWFYLGKLAWPADLIFVYPRWNVDAGVLWQFLFPLAAVAAAVVLWATGRRGLLASFLIFVGSLFPALGFVNVYPFLFSFVADHFQYLACLGILAPAAAGLALAVARWPRWGRAGCLVLMVVLGLLTWRQSRMYRDPFTLYETTLAKNPACWMAHNNLAEALSRSGRPADAIPHLETALELRPEFPDAENNLGFSLTLLGRPVEAIPHHERALRLQPEFAEANNNLGIALMYADRPDDGIAQFREAIRLKPHFALARFNLGLALARNGKTAEAIEQFAAAVRFKPDYADAELNWGIALASSRRLAEALPHLDRAVELRPEDPDIQVDYGRVLASAGRADDAIAHFQRALALNPNHSDAHLNLALALRQVGRVQEGAAHYEEAMRLRGGGATPRE